LGFDFGAGLLVGELLPLPVEPEPPLPVEEPLELDDGEEPLLVPVVLAAPAVAAFVDPGRRTNGSREAP
jgi:hypothetical protein